MTQKSYTLPRVIRYYWKHQMASITERKTKEGTKFLAQIVRRKVDYQESKTFATRAEAQRWAKRRELEIDRMIERGERPLKKSRHATTLADAIDKYVSDYGGRIGSTKAQVLKTIRNEYEIAGMACENIKSKHIVDFVKAIRGRAGVRSAATALNYLSHLAAVFKVAHAAWGLPLSVDEMRSATAACTALKYTAKAKRRTRRPTLEELDQLMEHFLKGYRARPSSCPMHKIVAFAIFSTRRQDEICRLK